ncbi:hypothetical protein [Oceanobacillus rekensis]|uniref:hypothetical protein n=1 Tax=Oceanobacillus rekensis TaxID=937927 RepID=UPI000B42DF61|nr:hypothetical protein [Oceanobacillus rekensis]
MYKFRGWTIETKVEKTLQVIIDKEESKLIMFDEDKDLFLWTYPSEFGEGLAFEKMNWATQFHILPVSRKENHCNNFRTTRRVRTSCRLTGAFLQEGNCSLFIEI